MDNLEEMDRFLEKFNLPRLNQEEVNIMNNPITSTEIEAGIKISPPKKKNKKKTPEPDGFTGKLYQIFREEVMPIFLKLFQKMAEEETLLNSFYNATHHNSDTKTRDNIEKRKLQPISLMNIDVKTSTKF